MFSLNFKDDQPIYQQVVNQVAQKIVTGELKPDEELPSVRKLAETLVINPNTIVRAYYELELMKIVEKRRGMGTFVTTCAPEVAKKISLDLLQGKIDELVQEAHRTSVSEEGLISRIRDRYDLVTSGKNIK